MNRSRDALMEEALSQIDVLMSYRRRAFCSQPQFREISMPQVYILMTLRERGPLTVSELASLLDVSAPSMSAILDRMEEHEFVRRVRNTVDRRVVHVEIQDRGRAMVEDIMGAGRDFKQRVLSSMTDAELEHVIGAVNAVGNALARLNGSPERNVEIAS